MRSGLRLRLDQPLGARAMVVAVVAALGVLLVAFAAATRPVELVAGSDVTVYQSYGSRIFGGEMPYRDFPMEYPPGAVAMFVPPAVAADVGSSEPVSWSPVNEAGRDYYRWFELLVLLLMAATVILTALTLAALGRPAQTVVLSLAVVAVSPWLLERMVTERFDVWPAALTAAALAASVRGRHILGGAMLGFGAAAKFYPALLLPVLAIVVVRQRGLRNGILAVGAAAAAAAAVFAPFAIASFSGTLESLRIQFRGGLQIESLASSVVVMASHVAETLPVIPRLSELTTQGAGEGLIRTDLAGPGVDATKIVMNVLLVAGLCLLWLHLARSTHDLREELLRYAAATVAIVLVFGTVLSPQYVVWLIPLVPLVGGHRGTAAVLLFVLAAVLTNVWIPDRYLDFQDGFDAGASALLLARNLALLAMAAVLVFPGEVLRRRRSSPAPPQCGTAEARRA